MISGTNMVFTPATNFHGTATITYIASDGSLGATGTVTIAVSPVNDAPLPISDVANTPEDVGVSIPVQANDYDVESSPLSLTGVTTTNGTAVISDAQILFAPATNFNGSVTLWYTISDGLLSATGKVTVAVSPVNDAPVAANDSITAAEDSTIVIAPLANDADVDGPSLSIINAATTNGILTLSSTNLTFRPATNFNGAAVIPYVISDGTLAATGHVTVTVTAVNDAPMPVNDVASTMEDTSVVIEVLGNDSDAEGSPLTITAVATTNGTALINGTSITFTPTTNSTEQRC